MRVSSQEGSLSTVTFFIDRSLGRDKVVAELRAKGALVEPHDSHFPADAPDQEWLNEVGTRGWIVISKDRRIRHRGAERAAVEDAKVALFIFRGGNMRGDEIAQAIAAALPRMLHLVQRQARPFIATISKGGAVKLLDRFR